LNDFLEDLELDAAHLTLSPLRLMELVEDDSCWLRRRELDKLKVLGDVLPVIHEKALQPVGHEELYLAFVLELLSL
jgi:hypothetical protein